MCGCENTCMEFPLLCNFLACLYLLIPHELQGQELSPVCGCEKVRIGKQSGVIQALHGQFCVVPNKWGNLPCDNNVLKVGGECE